MANVEARRGTRTYEDASYSDEELTQAAFAWLWERIASGEEIRSVSALFKKSCLVTQKTKAIRRMRRDWLIKQRTHIMSGAGAFAPPANSEESKIGVGRNLPDWDTSLPEREHETALVIGRLREVHRTLRPREQEVLKALCAALDRAEAAEVLGVTENNFRQMVFRLRDKLKRQLLPQG